MNSPLVSVIIPAYGGAEFIGEAIQSVLAQTYPHFELIIVNDASPDNTTDVVNQFNDPRLKYIIHDINQGAVAARLTGLNASSGEIIALLDQDDLFHPEKLEAHVSLMEQDPEIGISFNGRYEFNGSVKALRGVWQVPTDISLAEMLLGFPFSPSDTLLKREWAFLEGIWDYEISLGSEIVFNGGEYIYCGRLFLAGCKFAGINRPLNYRRYHPGRVFSRLRQRCETELTCQSLIFSDPRCPDDVRVLRDIAFANTYLDFGCSAFVQNEIDLGKEFLQEAVRLNPALLKGNPSPLIDFLVTSSTDDDSRDHEDILRKIFGNLPPEINWLSEQSDCIIARSYFLKGIKAGIWGLSEDLDQFFGPVNEFGGEIDESYLYQLTDILLQCEIALGAEAAQNALQKLIPHLEKIGNRQDIRALQGNISINRAFQNYQNKDYDRVLKDVKQAIISDPKYLTNRGMWSIVFRSLLQRN